MAGAAATSDPLVVMTAGSMAGPVRELARLFGKTGGGPLRVIAGPSGDLRARIEGGERCDVFASANVAHPSRLATAGLAGPAAPLASTTLAALCHARLGATTGNLLDLLLDPQVRVATSTPRHDPCGDYAWALFRLAERVRRGSYATLSRKALKLTGGPGAMKPPRGGSVYSWAIEAGHADLFLTYLPTAARAAGRSPALQLVPPPPALTVRAGMAVCVTASDRLAAWRFAFFALSLRGRRVFAKWGFDPPPGT